MKFRQCLFFFNPCIYDIARITGNAYIHDATIKSFACVNGNAYINLTDECMLLISVGDYVSITAFKDRKRNITVIYGGHREALEECEKNLIDNETFEDDSISDKTRRKYNIYRAAINYIKVHFDIV